MRPFFSFYGSKWRVAPYYPKPRYSEIREPFAGSAGYALRYPERTVVLYDVDPIIAGVWGYLIRTPAREIRRLSTDFSAVDDKSLPQEARWLIGFWLDKGMPQPSESPGTWCRSGDYPTQFWGDAIRERIALQVDYIRDWKIRQWSWEKAFIKKPVTYFVDPPYASEPGRAYTYDEVSYRDLAQACEDQSGQVIVCEQEGADWLPFHEFGTIKSNARSKTSKEVMWTNREEINP